MLLQTTNLNLQNRITYFYVLESTVTHKKFLLFAMQKLPKIGNVIKLTENDKEAGVCLYVSERTPAITYTKMA